MSNRIVIIAGTALFLAVAVGPALAGQLDNQIFAVNLRGLPEPATMTLLGLGIGGAYLARKFTRRK